MKPLTSRSLRSCGGSRRAAALSALIALGCVGGVGALLAPPLAARAQMSSADPNAIPANVLLFPAIIGSDTGAPAMASPAQASAEKIVTSNVQSMLEKGKIGSVIYTRRLPSIERAVAEGMKPEDAKAGPGDDPTKVRHFAELAGSTEYLTLTIDDYKYDATSRTATFNLSMSRYKTENGSGLGATAQKAIGTAPASIPAPDQESYAVNSAAMVASEQTVESVFPQVAATINPPKDGKKHHKGKSKYIIPVLAVGAALIAPHT